MELRKASRGEIRRDSEDLAVTREELDGLRTLTLDEPGELRDRIRSTRTVFWEYEQAKRDLSGGNLRLVVSIAKRPDWDSIPPKKKQVNSRTRPPRI